MLCCRLLAEVHVKQTYAQPIWTVWATRYYKPNRSGLAEEVNDVVEGERDLLSCVARSWLSAWELEQQLQYCSAMLVDQTHLVQRALFGDTGQLPQSHSFGLRAPEHYQVEGLPSAGMDIVEDVAS